MSSPPRPPRPSAKPIGTLHQKAEARLREKVAAGDVPASLDISDSRLLHELQVHQVELELQNEELFNARAVTEKLVADYTDLYDFAPIGYLTLNRAGEITRSNLASAILLSGERQHLQGKTLAAFVTDVSMPQFNQCVQRSFSEESEASCEISLRSSNRPLTIQLVACSRGDGAECRVVLTDITEHKQAEAKLQLAASVFNQAREGILITDVSGAILKVNDSFTRITGYDRAEVLGKKPSILQSGHQPPFFYASMWKELLSKGYWTGEIWNRHKSGSVYAEMLTISSVYDLTGETKNYVGMFTDITHIKEHQKQLEHMAHYDILTELPNRMLFADRLHQAMRQCSRRDQMLAVAFLDLDGFKAINDKYDHATGDQFLVSVSRHLTQALREGDTLARIGGDEFVAVLVDLETQQDCEPVLSRLLSAASRPISLGNETMQVSASIGVTFYPQDGIDPDMLLRQADQAMYIAKEAGKNCYHFFDVNAATESRNFNQRRQRIKQGLDNGEFTLYYQPKVNMKTGAVIGAEALIRWLHPEQGLLAPDLFLPLVEGHAMSVDMGEWVINTALAQISQWQADGLYLPVSVNVGASQLQSDRFLTHLTVALAAHSEVNPSQLELEILETSALEDVIQVRELMGLCMELGVIFSLDDFGTGFSSLTYLKHLPVTTIKIDHSFVRDILADADDLAIVQGIVGLANAFQRIVIAEGVETEAHGAMLLAMGCEQGQGYGIARPMPATDIPSWVAKWQTDRIWAA